MSNKEGNYPLTIRIQNLRLVDERFGDGPRYYLTEPKDIDMRVPDQVRKCVLFVGLPELPDPEYRGTAFIVTVPGKSDNHFAFMVTARHVAEVLEGNGFYIRANKKRGGTAELRGVADNPWWYHPTEREFVDCAVTMFAPARLAELDVEPVPIALFADQEKIKEHNVGIGDEVFIAGLFTKVTETSQNIPIVRIGNVAMMPEERIPFDKGRLYEAHLIESRSIGGLSGSPVFVRPTIGVQVGKEDDQPVILSGAGKILFFGSVIGHWEVPEGFTRTQAEAVNMGIAPVVPASKIKEVIMQPELVELMAKIDAEMRVENQKGARLDFADSNQYTQVTPKGATIPVPTQDQFLDDLKKASRKLEDENS
ncbi:MAG: hypothetical protein WCC92_19245 [Candidatus Korobacteraceae bacterium]